MAKDDKDFFKEKNIWSVIKDRLLEGYLIPYFQKVLTTRQPILYVDCFAGKGKFDDGNDGSPRIALKVREGCLDITKVNYGQIDICLINSLLNDINITNLLASFVNEFGILCDFKTIYGLLDEMESEGIIKINRDPAIRKNGTPTKFWEEKRSQTVIIRRLCK